MLANAADANCPVDMRTAFVSMLGEMTLLDVAILAKLAAAEPPVVDSLGNLPTWNLPDQVSSDGEPKVPEGAVAVSLANLARLGCVLRGVGFGGPLGYSSVNMSPLGRAFVAACATASKP